MTGKQLSHAELWDDTVLQDSWNEALAEYKKYHSLAVKGERVKLNSSSDETEPLSNGDGMLESGHNADKEVHTPTLEVPRPEQVAAESKVPVLPQVMLGSVQNEDMKHLMMSWYYAGYYTGLYEGKQQGYAMAAQQQAG